MSHDPKRPRAWRRTMGIKLLVQALDAEDIEKRLPPSQALPLGETPGSSGEAPSALPAPRPTAPPAPRLAEWLVAYG